MMPTNAWLVRILCPRLFLPPCVWTPDGHGKRAACFQLASSTQIGLLQACGRQTGWLSQELAPGFLCLWGSVPAHRAVTRPLRPGTTTKDWKNKELRNCPKGTTGHNSNLIYFDLLAQTFSGPLGPFRIIGCEGWLTLTTSVFWSWVRTPYQIVPSMW